MMENGNGNNRALSVKEVPGSLFRESANTKWMTLQKEEGETVTTDNIDGYPKFIQRELLESIEGALKTYIESTTCKQADAAPEGT